MRIIDVQPETIHRKIRKLQPGRTLQLAAGRYQEPVVISNVCGTRENPIRLRGVEDTVFGSDTSRHEYRKIGNRLAADQERGGRFPSLRYVADEAYLILRDCQWVVVEDIAFKRCWPTAIYIENCQRITLRHLHFEEGTFAIGATGANTRHLTIEHCKWQQDTSDDHELWNEIPWKRLHGYWRTYSEELHEGEKNGHVNIKEDERALDGDFFRAWNIAGYVVFRKNEIKDAFNAIHFFNREPGGPSDVFSRNVLIEDNTFERIRDNAIEPEDFAWNWIVRHNRFIDCYSTFSIDMARSGFFYVYGNLGWNWSRPGPGDDPHTLGRIYKLPKRHRAEGPHYFVHNSWFIRAPIASKKRFCKFIHLNNAIDYNVDLKSYDRTKSAPFGREWWDRESSPNPWERERKRFTKRWAELDIRFDGDIVNHPYFPADLRGAGYALGASSRGGAPGFTDPREKDSAEEAAEGLKLQESSQGRKTALEFEVEFPNGKKKEVEAGGDVGAWQGDRLFELPGLHDEEDLPEWMK